MALFMAPFNRPILQADAIADPAVSYGDVGAPFIGMLGVRILFLHLFVAALVTWALRRGLAESARWVAASTSVRKVKALFSGPNLRGMVWTGVIYLFWNLAAGTAGIFNPYFIETLHAGSPAASAGLSSLPFVFTMIATLFLFMPFSDRSYGVRRLMWGVGAIIQICAWGLFLFAPFEVGTVLINLILWGLGAALAGEAFYKVFSQELFPTMHRGTAQGITFGVARVLLGVWSFLVPILLGESDIKVVAAWLTLFLVISGGVGYLWMPDTAGKSLEQIEAERHR
jgi:inositol transporter-like SP family MFS transporter